MPIPIKVITSGAFAAALKRLAPLYEEQTGQPIDLQFGSSIGAAHDSIPTRLSNGQQFDILVLAAPALEKFILDGTIKPDSRIDLAGSKMAAAVRASDPAPDLSTLESFKQVLLSTPRIAYSASASGTYLSSEVFPKLGISDQMAISAKRIFSERVGTILMRHEADLGFQQVSELLPIPGLTLIRQLPPEIEKTFYFSAGIMNQTQQLTAVQKLISFLASKEAAPIIIETGLEPVKTSV